MGANSESKSVIKTTPPSLAGKARVDLVKSDFDAIVEQKGYRVYVDKVITCPCVVKSNNQALSSCKNCGGSGYVYINRYETRLVMQSMNMQTKFKEWSEENLGTVKITARQEQSLAFMDRITVLEALSIHHERKHIKDKDGDKFIKLTYKPIYISDAYLFIDGDVKLKRLVYNTDYTVSGNKISITPALIAAIEYPTISIRYKHHPEYHIIDLPRETISTTLIDKTSGRDKSVIMPVHAVGRRSHYVLDEQDIDNTFLLDNSYDDPCGDLGEVQVNDLTCEIRQ